MFSKRMMKKPLILLTVFLLHQGAKICLAQEMPTCELGEIVITATRTEKELKSAPGSVFVVSKKDVEKRNNLTVEAALNTVPGFFSRREKGIVGLVPVFSLHGIAGTNRTLILMDGITLNEPRTGIAYLDGIPADNVERIEVIRGPVSSLYGGYAMGGVVNILTKMPEKREFTIKSGYGSSMDIGDGWDDIRKFSLSYGDRLNNKLSFFLSYGRSDTNGYPLQLNVQTTKPSTGITGWTSNGYANDIGKTDYPKNYDARNASIFSPKTAVVYKPFKKTTLKTSIGKAYRHPTIYELYNTYKSASGITTEANTNLKPEGTTSWDIGTEHELWEGCMAGWTYFENNIKDMIYTKTITSTYQERANAGKAKSKGVEVEIEQHFEKCLKLLPTPTKWEG